MADRLLFNPKHWQDRAEEARAVAAQLDDATARDTMLNIAAAYDKLAREAQRRLEEEQVRSGGT